MELLVGDYSGVIFEIFMIIHGQIGLTSATSLCGIIASDVWEVKLGGWVIKGAPVIGPVVVISRAGDGRVYIRGKTTSCG